MKSRNVSRRPISHDQKRRMFLSTLRSRVSRALRFETLEDRSLLTTYFFSNPAPITIPAAGTGPGPGSPYPSNIAVSNLPGTVDNVTTAMVSNLSHTAISDVDILLTAPNPGVNVQLMSFVGAGPVVNETYTFQDGAPSMPFLGDPGSGTFSPTQFTADPGYEAPAPAGPYGTTMAALNGTSPNGTWSLYVHDDAAADTGSIAGGWGLAVTTNTGTTFVYNAATNPGVTDYTLRVNGANFEIINTSTGFVLASQSVADTSTIDVNGQDLVNDTFRVNYAGGLTIPGGGLDFSGGTEATADGDSIVLFGSSPTTVTHNLATSSTGSIAITGQGLFTYSGLEPIFDNLSPVNRVFNFSAAANTDVVLQDFGSFADGLNIISAPLSAEFVIFVQPTTSFTVNLGDGADIMEMRTLDTTWVAPTINLNGDSGQDEIRIAATPATATTNLNTNLGTPVDRTVLGAIVGSGGNDATDFAQFNTGVSTLDLLNGPVVSVDDSGGVGQLFADDSGDVTGDAVVFSTGSIIGASPATINYNGFNLDAVQLALGSGNDIVNVTGTGSYGTTTIFGNGGADAFTIAGDNLNANNNFQGGPGTDDFILNITTDIGSTAVFPIQSLLIQGNDPGLDTVNRDRLTITDNNAAFARNINYHYVNSASGDIDIAPGAAGAGLAGGVAPALAVQVRTMETVVFNSPGGTNDLVTVTGTATNDLLTVGLRNNNTSAFVFRDGTPYLSAPPITIANSRPGVAGGSAGPDLLINGMSAAAGIMLDGGGIPAGGGDRAIVYAASENNLIDVGNPTDIFGFGAGVLQPGFGVGNAHDTISVTDSTVTTTNNAFGPLTTVHLNVASFVQGTPASSSQQSALIVNGGDEAAQQASGVADNFTVTPSTSYNIEVNGNLPVLTTVNGVPQGDQLNVAFPGSINVFSDAASPPNVTVTGQTASSGSPFGVKFSSIERVNMTPGNGIVNLIGDNNDPAVTQNDYFKVRGGIDPLGIPGPSSNGSNQFSLQIGGSYDPATGNVGAPPPSGGLSAPIFFYGVTRINASGGEATGFDTHGNAIPQTVGTGIDVLDITPYADNTPRGWGIETYFNEGDPDGDGGQPNPDLLIFNGVAGVSDSIAVQPSASMAGQVYDNNSATNTPIAVVNYVLNTNIIVNGQNGAAGETDSLTLRGTNGTTPASAGTSGNETVDADFTRAGTAGNEWVRVTDTVGGAALYNLQTASNFDVIHVELLDGNDTMTLVNSATVSADVDAGRGNDILSASASAVAVVFRGGEGDDTLTGGAGSDRLEGGTGNDILVGLAGSDTELGGDGDDRFGDPAVHDPAANDAGNDFFDGGAGSDSFFWDPGDGEDTIEGGAGDSDQLFFSGNAGAEQFFLFADTVTPSRFHLFRVQAAIDIDAADLEEVNVTTLGGTDTVTIGRSDPGTGSVLSDLSTTTVRVVDVSLGTDGAADNVIVEGRPADDNLLVSLSSGFIKTAGLPYDVRLDGADPALDRLTVNGNEGDDTVVAAAGVETAIGITLNGGIGNDFLSADGNINGNEGNDTLVGGPGNNALDGGPGDDTFIGNGGTDAIGGGAVNSVGDTILLGGTTGNDLISLGLDAVGHLIATVNGLTTTYTDFLGGPIATSGIEQILVQGLAGNDSLTVDSTNGAISIPINFDGGDNADLLTLTGGTATSDTYTPGPNPGQGTSAIVIGGVTQTVTFTNLEPVVDLVAGPLAVNGNNADNAINYSQGSVVANGLVSVDAFESIEFSNKTTLSLNALAGSDTINLNNPNTPTGLTGITVNGGDPTASDTVIVNGTTGVDAVNISPTGPDSATVTGLGPTVNVTTAEHLTYNGQGGADLLTVTSPAGRDFIEYTPGGVSAFGSGLITMNRNVADKRLPVQFEQISFNGTLTLADTGGIRTDELWVNGTQDDDRFLLSSTGRLEIEAVPVTGFFPESPDVLTNGIDLLHLRGHDGDDIFNIPGNHPYQFGVKIEGGNPSASDVLNFTGAGATVAVDLAASTVGEAGFAAVTFSGVEILNVNAGAGAITVNGTTGPDNISVTPTSATTARIIATGVNTTINTTNTATLTIDPLGGGDNLAVYGTQSGETLTVNSTTVVATTSGFKTVTYTSANTENLQIFALASSDTIDVTPSATTTMFVDGGDPIGNGATPADIIALHPVGLFAVEPGPESDEGGLFNPPNQRVSWDHIERVTVVGGPGVGPALVLGTNGDDDITIIARDSSTHAGTDGVQDFTVSVNDGTDVLYINVPVLLVDALAGDDDIVVREPAPNNAVWDVDIYVAGGTPASLVGDLGDQLSLETPGDQAVTYTPAPTNATIPAVLFVTFPATPSPVDTFQFTDTTNSSTITAVPFSINVVDVFVYNSSPGGVEQAIYQAMGGVDTLTYASPAGGSDIDFTPGATADAGTVTAKLLAGTGLVPLTFQGQAGTVTFSNAGGRVDNLHVNGTGLGENFTVNGAGNAGAGLVRLFKNTGGTIPESVVLNTNSVANLFLHGRGGVDTFNLTGALPYTGVTVDADATVNLAGAVGPVTVTLGDNTPGSANPDTVITGYGAPVVLIGVDTANLDANAQQVTATGTTQNDNIVFTPTGAAAGTFYDDIPSGNNLVPNTVFNISNTTGNFRVFNDPSGNADQVTLRGTAARDLIEINQGSGVATVLANNVTTLLPVQLGISSEILNALGLGGQDTFQIIPAPGIGGQAQDNMLINLDGGASGENNALVIGASFGAAPATLAANQFVVVNRGRTPDTGTVRVFTAAVANPDINYKSVQVVVPIVAGTSLNPNSLFIGPDNFEQNDQLGNAAYLGADSTLQVEHASVFPNSAEFPGVPADQDFYRVVAQTTGTLDVQVYFRQIAPSLLPGGGDIDIEVRDAAGNVVAGFGSNDTTDNERVRFPAVAGQTYYVRVFGAAASVVNGYNMTIINTAAPVPFDIELLDTPINTATNSVNGTPVGPTAGPNSDTGRDRFDDITFDNDPTILIRVPNVIQVGGLSFIDDIPANGNAPGAPGSPPDETILIPFVTSTATNAPSAGFRVAVFVTENNTTDPVLAGYAQPIAGRPGVFTFTFANDFLAPDGSYFISASVEMIDPTLPEQNQGFGDLAESLEAIIDTTLPPASFGSPAVGNDGLILSDDCPTPLINLTNVARPTFWGRAEADTVINLYLDSNANGVFDPATDVFLGQTVATPFDGGDQYPNGYWEIQSRLSLNDPSVIVPLGVLPFDGPRTLFITAEDVAGNITGSPTAVVATTLQIVVDTQGPQVTDVQIAGSPAYNLFGLKPENAPQGPTPLVNSLIISFQDLPPRVAGTLYNALEAGTVVPGNFHLVGDYNGIIPIQNIILVNNPPVAGLPATATVELVFRTPGPDGVFNTPDDVGKPLPDDRFTLTVDDNVTDPLCNALNGESNANEPNGSPNFPSGDAHNGGDFVARFTVDSRAEVGTWGAGAAWIDTNGNTTFDQNNPDFVNRDITYYMGFTSDNLFAGNFVKAAGGVADGFDKLAAYGKVGSSWRFIVDVDNDGVITPGVDISVVDPAGINGVPVAGNFDGNAANGDEVGIFTGTTWYFDTNHDFKVDLASAVPWTQNGYPVVGNFDGVAGDDLATYRDNTFFIDFGRNGSIDKTFRFGFPTPNNRPVSADVDRDGNDDLGLFVPNRAGVSPHEDAEWYILVSGGAPVTNRIHADPIDGVPVIDFKPVPFGNDLYIQYGDEFGLPLLANFDPPVAPGAGTSGSFLSSNPKDPLDVNNDGFVTPIDALLVINEINTHGSHALTSSGFHTAPFIDTDKDNVVSPHDVLLVINRLNAPPAGSPGAEGEASDLSPASAHDVVFSQLGGATAPAVSDATVDAGIFSLLADDQIRAKRSRQGE